MSIEKHFCSYEQSKELKELGFDIKNEINVEYGYGHFMDVILKSQAFEFFRGKYGLYICTVHIESTNKWEFAIFSIEKGFLEVDHYDTYEEAESAALNKLIELAKEQE